MWTFYDILIDGIDESIFIDRVVSGQSRTVVTAGEYPEAACEYLPPEMDFAFITGSATVNRTMPRLLK